MTRRRAREAVPGGTAGAFVHDGRRLYYEEYGDGDHLLVYLHGLLLDSNLNRTVARRLAARGYRVVLLDLLGHGRSDKPPHAAEYRMDLYVEQVLGLLDHLGAGEAALGGLSLGANVSLLTAVAAPERVRGLVLEMPVLERAAPAVAMTIVPLVIALHYGRRTARLVTGAARRLPRGAFGPLDSVLNAASLPPDGMAAVLHGILVGPVAPTFDQRAAVGLRTLVVAHGRDLIHPFSDAAALVRQLPDATLVRAHSIYELRFRPARLVGEIGSFLDTLWSSGEPEGAGSGERAA